MEMLTTIYPYTLYLLAALAVCAFFVLIALLIQLLKTFKALKLTLSPVASIQARIETIAAQTDHLSVSIKDKNSQLKQFLKKLGLFLAAWHFIFPKKDKRRR